MHEDLPAPVAPAMRMWGTSARLTRIGPAGDVAADGDLEGVGGLVGLGRAQDVAHQHELALLVGHLDADGRAAGDGRQDADVGRRHGVGDVLVQVGDPGHLHARAQRQLVAGDGGADGHAHQAGVDPVGGQGPLQGPALGLDQGVVDLLGLAPLEQGEGRQLPGARARRPGRGRWPAARAARPVARWAWAGG